jgi:hypothetical protein
MGKMIFAWVLVNAVDAASTLTLLSWGNREANPLMPLTPWQLIVFKAIGCFIVILIAKKYPSILKPVSMGIGVYAVWNVSWMVLLR